MPSTFACPILLLLFVSMFSASCSGQQATGPSAKNSPVSEGPQAPAQGAGLDTAQIAEYVVAVFEDGKGHLWFGTMNKGVARHDGRALTYFTEKDGLCGNTIHSITEDKDGALWFGGHAGVCKYDGKSFTRFFDTEGRVGTDRSDTIWVSTGDGVHRHDGTSFTRFDIPLAKERPAAYSIWPGRVTFQLEDSKGNLWFSTDGHGAIRYDGRSFTQFTKKEGLCSNTVWSILEDRQGRVWFTCIQAYQPGTTGDGGVCYYDGRTFTRFPDVAGLSENDIYTIYEERSGNLWIGATRVGAYRYDGKAFTLFEETDRPDLTVNFGLQAMSEDRNGTLWFGFSGGLFRFDGKAFVNVTQGGPW
ncbi:ligand-binding sensor domain-containing protein [Nannocystis radixulma]|uniref:Two-component regulator propeller domain-containing protein n=1 Tax=Nannocystis radixulma TaxID=2995305 RepID=A0ABT5AYI1_9BACT|nr:two-component regulator propeller domain-containing protein [Nannocystis radixulma]MDC0666897.1 two-component regulator propeller domain-containing protein [Nannocystis radixulma]